MQSIDVDQEFILETLRANRERIRKDFGIERIGLYGSFARNEQTGKSDIDLVYELSKGKKLLLKDREQLNRILRRKLHRKLDLVNYEVMNPFVRYYMRKDVIYV